MVAFILVLNIQLFSAMYCARVVPYQSDCMQRLWDLAEAPQTVL